MSSPPPNECSVNQNRILKIDPVGGGGVKRGQDSPSTALQKEKEKLPVPSTSSLEPFLGNLGILTDRGGPKISSKEDILRNILSRSQKEKKNVILTSIKPGIEVIPSWSSQRKHRRFLTRMDRAHYNIEMLGLIEEVPEHRIYLAKPPPNEHQIYRENDMIPPLDRIKDLARLFGGTIGENKACKESLRNSKSKLKIN